MPTPKKSATAKAASKKSKTTSSGGPKTKATAKAKPAAAKSAKGPTSKAAASKSSKASTTKTAKKSSGAKSSTKSPTSKASPAKKKTTSKATASKARTATTKRSTSSPRAKKRATGKGIIAKAIDAVAGIFTPGSPDAIDLLKTDHRTVEDLFAKVKSNEDGNNAATFKKIKQELDVHAHIEETIFYPHLLEQGDKELKKIVREGIEEHGQVKDLLVELAELPGDSPTFKAKITVLMENVEHHVEEEEDEMFPMVEDQIDSEMLQRIGSLMYGEKLKVGRMSPAAAPKARKAAASSRK